MQNKWLINILLIIIMILVVIACTVTYICLINDVEIIEKKQETALFSYEDYPNIDCSASILPLAEAFKENFTGGNINNIDTDYSKSNNLYLNLINRKTDLILTTYPSKEEQELADNNDVELEIIPIAKDALIFFVNKNNLVDDLSLSQVQNIYSGKIKNWKDVGGIEEEIIAYQKPEKSNSQIGMLEIVMKGNKMITPKTEVVSQGGVDIIDVISDYDNNENSIGYSYLYYYTTIYTSDKMKLLSIDGIEPTYENIKTGLYNLQTTYYAVIRKDEKEDSNIRKLLNAMISEEGQNIAKEAGYVQNY